MVGTQAVVEEKIFVIAMVVVRINQIAETKGSFLAYEIEHETTVTMLNELDSQQVP